MKKIILIRHAESESNVGGIVEHNRLVKLTENGKKQAIDLTEVLDKPDRIIVSKYLRTQETAEPFIKKLENINHKHEVHLWLDTHEFDYLDRSKFLNKPREELDRFANLFWKNGNASIKFLESGENFGEFIERVHRLILKLNKLEGVNVVFTHGILIVCLTLLVRYYSKQKFEQQIGNYNFYSEIMEKSDEHYRSGEIVQLKNTEIFDVTELVEKYCE